MTMDPRLQAFRSRRLQSCFHAVIQESEIWRRDPFDVETLHSQAREQFDILLQELLATRETVGRIWLIRGESGAGKTHLMRAFRNQLHDAGLGYFSYMQMTAAESNYPRYILKNTLDSLDKPYRDDPTGSSSGLMRLSRALAGQPVVHASEALVQLREDPLLNHEEVVDRVFELADQLADLPELAEVELGLIRALLFLQRDDNRLKRRVLSLLRCEDLPASDRRILGDIAPYRHDDDPRRVLIGLGQLVWQVDGGALVVCLDQLEDAYRQAGEEGELRFRTAVQAALSLVSHSPRVLVVISCLSNYYEILRQQLSRSDLDRIEHDPEPTDIATRLSAEDIETLIARRLEALYEHCEVDFDEADPLYPFPADWVDRLRGLSAREVLIRCQQARDQSHVDGLAPTRIDNPLPPPSPEPEPEADLLGWEQRWNDHLTGDSSPPPDEDAEQLDLLLHTLQHCADELAGLCRFRCHRAKGAIELDFEGHNAEQRLVFLCNKTAIGGSLSRQLQQAERQAGRRRLVLVRSTAFPGNPKTKIAQQLGELIARKGASRVVVEDSDWRAMAAMQAFRARHGTESGFTAWLNTYRPLSVRPALKTILDFETEPPPPPPPPGDVIDLGSSRDFMPEPVRLDTRVLTRHAAFLGSSGSGKTTLALRIIEQLLLQGVPVLIVDRKGDLCSYARPEVWQGDADRPADNARKAELMECLDIQLHTPGNPQGRPLGIPIVPAGLADLPANEREQLAIFAAAALAGMMHYKDRGADKTRRAILTKAISVLAELQPGEDLNLERLIAFIDSGSSVLINAIGGLDPKHCRKLTEDLVTLQLANGMLFTSEGEQLDCEALFGLGPHGESGRTRLSIISTAFLGDDTNVVFWVAQLLLAIGRFARRQPADRLQCAVLLDEADLYLPASSKPATKEPLENLLKRARSAGIGIFLSTQSPGDLDYKSRDQISTWFLGKITQTTALNKLKPMFSAARTDIGSQLPNQEIGQFYMVQDGRVTSLQAEASLIRAEQVPEAEILQLTRQ